MSETIELEAQYSNALASPDHLDRQWGPSWLNSEVTLDPESPEIPKENEPIEPETWYPGQFEPAESDLLPRFPDELEADSEYHWSQISDSEYRYLTSPREYPIVCAWCGGRLHHSQLCDELRASWEVSLPFGKYRGTPLSQVPKDYLAWLLTNGERLAADTRAAIEEVLRGQDG